MSVNFGCFASSAAVSRLPLEKSSSPTTSCPSRSRVSARCPPMKPATPVTHTFDISGPPRLARGSGRLRRSEGVGEPAGLPSLRRGQLVAGACVGVQLRLAELLALGPDRKHLLLLPDLGLAPRPQYVVRLTVTDLIRQLEAGVAAAGGLRDSEHEAEQEQGLEAVHGRRAI